MADSRTRRTTKGATTAGLVGVLAAVGAWTQVGAAQPRPETAAPATPVAAGTPAAKAACPAVAGVRHLPATGQIITQFPGDDGSVRAGAPLTYIDNHDGTITDCATGLMWEKKVKLDRVKDVANLHDADNCYPWRGVCAGSADAECGSDTDCGMHGACITADCQVAKPNGLTIFKWVARLNAERFAGYADWRVPNTKELQSLVDYNVMNPSIAPAFTGASCSSCSDLADPACSCTQSANYWSSTMLPAASDGAWVVYFNQGTVVFNVKTTTCFVRAVRGGL